MDQEQQKKKSEAFKALSNKAEAMKNSGFWEEATR